MINNQINCFCGLLDFIGIKQYIVKKETKDKFFIIFRKKDYITNIYGWQFKIGKNISTYRSFIEMFTEFRNYICGIKEKHNKP